MAILESYALPQLTVLTKRVSCADAEPPGPQVTSGSGDYPSTGGLLQTQSNSTPPRYGPPEPRTGRDDPALPLLEGIVLSSPGSPGSAHLQVEGVCPAYTLCAGRCISSLPPHCGLSAPQLSGKDHRCRCCRVLLCRCPAARAQRSCRRVPCLRGKKGELCACWSSFGRGTCGRLMGLPCLYLFILRRAVYCSAAQQRAPEGGRRHLPALCLSTSSAAGALLQERLSFSTGVGHVVPCSSGALVMRPGTVA